MTVAEKPREQAPVSPLWATGGAMRDDAGPCPRETLVADKAGPF